MNKKSSINLISILFFAIYSAWWLFLYLNAGPEDPIRNYFTDTYGILAGLGGIIGIIISKKWGGMRSYVGKAVVFFSVGLLFQFLGQLSYSLEFYLYNIENSYPSFGEIFFSTSVPAYILGVYYIAKASGFSISLSKMSKKLGSVVIPIIMMSLSYYFFIHGIDLTEMSATEKFLFIFYPLGQATFVSFALLAYYLTENVLGGVMRRRVFFILFSLIFQYVADSLFIYRTSFDLWFPADISEYMFVISYFLMTMALIDFLNVFNKLKNMEKVK